VVYKIKQNVYNKRIQKRFISEIHWQNVIDEHPEVSHNRIPKWEYQSLHTRKGDGR